jgi:acyl-CoA synthetase (AMP-forming)/AMP-acid ligase II
MQGYWLDPTATERRIKNGILHTGDLGYSDDEGYLFITGRSSEMIKSGGFLVNPEEIEEVLREQDGVSDAGVAGVADDLLGEVIVAGVVVQAARESVEKQLLAHCVRHLSSYKRPQAIYLMTGVPRSANGKILRPALRERLESLHRKTTLDGISSSR